MQGRSLVDATLLHVYWLSFNLVRAFEATRSQDAWQFRIFHILYVVPQSLMSSELLKHCFWTGLATACATLGVQTWATRVKLCLFLFGSCMIRHKAFCRLKRYLYCPRSLMSLRNRSYHALSVTDANVFLSNSSPKRCRNDAQLTSIKLLYLSLPCRLKSIADTVIAPVFFFFF